MAGRSVFTVLEQTAKRCGNAVALYQPKGSKAGGGHLTFTWNEWVRASREIALGLRALGLNKGDIVCTLCETRAEFYLVDLGVMGGGGISAALYTAYPMPDLARGLVGTGARFLFAEDPKTLTALTEALAANGHSLPRHVILITGEHLNPTQAGVLSFAQLRQMGRSALERDPSLFAHVQEELTPEDGAILYLTSGATGEPKMGVSSHAAVTSNLEMGVIVFPIQPEDSMLAFLPSAHIAQRIVSEFMPMRMGTPVWFSESLARLPAELRSIRPTVFLAPPRVWEKIYTTVQSELKKRPPAAKKIFYGALGLGAEAAKRRQAGKPLPGWMKSLLKVADKLVFSKIRERVGGRLRIAACGAAPLGKDLAEFFAAIGMPLIEGYGLTEAGILCFNPLGVPRPGSVGKALPGMKLRLAEDGELQVQSPCLFKGYYRDEAATRSVMTEDGWFSTGDIAEVDEDGFWYITGRKKELIVSSNGKKIYPSRIENLFKMEPVVNQVLLVGDKKPYVTALLTLNIAQVQSLEGMKELAERPLAEIVEAEPVAKAVQSAVARVNKHLADFERIRRYKVLDREWTIEHGELTPTMKIRRSRVLENHKALVSELYLGREEVG